MSAPSIRARLSRLVLLLSLVWALLASIAVWVAVRHEVEELLDETLQDSTDVLAELLDASALALGPARVIAASQGGSHFAWQLVDADGRILLRSQLAPAEPWHVRPRLGFSDVQGQWRSYGRALSEAILYVAQTRAERRETLAAVGLASAGTALAVGFLCMWTLSIRVRRELQPLTEFSQALLDHDPLAQGATLPPAARLELAPIRDAIDELSQRLARRIANERAFTAHAAHALRTPLAGMDAQLAVALREASAEAQPRLLRTREAAARLRRVVTALLTLFRSGVDLQWQPVDVGGLLARLPVEGLALVLRDDDASVQADPDLLAAALINLLDNALRCGASQVRVELQGQTIRLLDDGRGTSPQHLAELQRSLALQQYEGRMGLGLMLADMVARAHGGSLILLERERGFGVELRLGAAPVANHPLDTLAR